MCPTRNQKQDCVSTKHRPHLKHTLNDIQDSLHRLLSLLRSTNITLRPSCPCPPSSSAQPFLPISPPLTLTSFHSLNSPSTWSLLPLQVLCWPFLFCKYNSLDCSGKLSQQGFFSWTFELNLFFLSELSPHLKIWILKWTILAQKVGLKLFSAKQYPWK